MKRNSTRITKTDLTVLLAIAGEINPQFKVRRGKRWDNSVAKLKKAGIIERGSDCVLQIISLRGLWLEPEVRAMA